MEFWKSRDANCKSKTELAFFIITSMSECTEEHALIHVLQTENLRLVAENARLRINKGKSHFAIDENGNYQLMKPDSSVKGTIKKIYVEIYGKQDRVALADVCEDILDIIYANRVSGYPLPNRLTAYIQEICISESQGDWVITRSYSGWRLLMRHDYVHYDNCRGVALQLLQYARDNNILEISNHK